MLDLWLIAMASKTMEIPSTFSTFGKCTFSAHAPCFVRIQSGKE